MITSPRTLIKAVKLFCFVGILSFYCDSQAECRSVRLDNPGEAFEKIPVYDQTNLNSSDPAICYAISTSELFDSARFYDGDRELTQLTSPISLAINSMGQVNEALFYLLQEQFQKKGLDYSWNGEPGALLGMGDVKKALEDNFGKEVCDQRSIEKFSSLIPKDLAGREHEGKSEIGEKGSLDEMFKSFLAARKAKIRVNLSKMEFGRISENLKCPSEGRSYFLLRAKTSDELKEVQEILDNAIEQKDITTAVKSLTENLCRSKKVYLKPRMVGSSDGYTDKEIKALNGNKTGDFGTKHSIKEIPQRLEKTVQSLLGSNKPMPVAISYSRSVLSEIGGYEDATIGGHVSVVIGQRFNSSLNKCEFLVRDSYGACEDNKDRYARV
jgi:hypothetical protein